MGGWSTAFGDTTEIRKTLGPNDPLLAVVEGLVAQAEAAESWADLALAILSAEPIFERLATWPPPAVDPIPSEFLREEPDESQQAALARIAMHWLATVAALEALEQGQQSEMARVLAAGAIALHCGAADGIDWLLRAIELSRV